MEKKKTLEASDKAILLTPKGTLTIGEEYSSPSISFYKNNEVEDVVTIHYSKFKYKGEEVKDLQTIYDIISEIIPNQNKQTNNMVVCIRDLNTSKNINTEERKQVPRKDECIVINKLYYKVFSVTWHYDDLLVIVDVVPFSSNQNK